LPGFIDIRKKLGMKNLPVQLSFLAILLYMTACTKMTTKATGSSDKTQNLSTSGQWQLITDSTYEGVGSTNHLFDYTGVAGDYFSFSANGFVYTKEGNVLDTLTYQLVSDSTMLISHFGLTANGIPDTCTITGLTGKLTSGQTGQTIVIESPFFLTPGGEFWRKVTLSW
jgi:hypothetical protein